jgi:ATP-dependent DNA helicase RecQ
VSVIDVEEPKLLEVLRQRFHHDAFRPGQREVTRALLAGSDVVAVLPTGAGKSLAYQLTAQFLPGLTVVVSPLLSLMKDQVESLMEIGVDARMISSMQSSKEVDHALDDATHGRTRLLYVTPERFEDTAFRASIQRAGVSLFVVDEAHSISEWGQSFRPAYLGLSDVVKEVGRPPVLALTATATRWVRQDIVDRLDLRNPVLVVRGTDRPNLFFEVTDVQQERQDQHVLHDLLVHTDRPETPVLHGSGIIYTATTRAAEETAGWLQEWGIRADYYHGRRKKSDRDRVQSNFMGGEVRVIVATNAFGLGVDKPDVRFVIHRDVPASLEAYYQEAGRAGRDGGPARCVLIYRAGDLGRAAFMSVTGQLTVNDLERGRTALVAQNGGTVRDLQRTTELGRGELLRMLELLEAEGVLTQRRGRVRLLRPDFTPSEISLEREQQRRAYERTRLDMMRGYAELRDCRRRYMLNYFGEEPDWARCGRCDVDLRQADDAPERPPGKASRFAFNDRVVHASLGEGVVQRVTRDALTVLFDRAGYKTLDLALVEQEALLNNLSAAVR